MTPRPEPGRQIIDLLPNSDHSQWSVPDPAYSRHDVFLARLTNSPVGCRALLGVQHSVEALRAQIGATATVLGDLGEQLRELRDILVWGAPARIVRRFLSGEPLTGRSRTDATFTRRGRRAHPHLDGRTGPLAFKAGIERLALRWMLTASCYAGGRLFAPHTTAWVAAILGGLILVGLVLRAQAAPTLRCHKRTHLIPLHYALRDIVRTTQVNPADWLHIPPHYRSPDAELRIDLPVDFTGHPRAVEHLETTVRHKLGLPELRARWHLTGHRPYVRFTRPTSPPPRVTWADLQPLLATAHAATPFIGLAAGGRPITVDLAGQSPHLMVSAGTGGGKSTLFRAILAQALLFGGHGVILDIKQFSHMWATDLPNCEYHISDVAIHEALLGLETECLRRSAHARAHADHEGNTDHIDLGPRIFIMAEEMNATILRLQSYWRTIKPKGAPLTSPAVNAFNALLFMGRQVQMHVLAAAQRGSARALGGPDARENFDTRALTQYSQATWRMLAPEIWPPPPKTKHPGRWQIVHAGTSTETQVVHLTPAQARELALTGARHHPPHRSPRQDTMSQHAPARPQLSAYRDELHQHVATPTTVATDVATPASPSDQPPHPYTPTTHQPTSRAQEQRLVGLREALTDTALFPTTVTLTGLRKTRERDPTFPPVRATRGKEKLYDLTELAHYAHTKYHTPTRK